MIDKDFNERFDGDHYNPEKDHKRLSGQLKAIYQVLAQSSKNNKWWTVSELRIETGFPEPSISAQLRNLRKQRFGAWNVEGRYRKGKRIFEYQIIENAAL